MVQLHNVKGDDWKAMADEYEKMTTETAVRPTGVMLERANALSPFSSASGILDNGCGPGLVMSRLLREYTISRECSLTCSDFSEAMISKVEEMKDRAVQKDGDSNWKRVRTIVQNAMDLESIEDGSMSHVTAGWVYFMTPDPQKCLSESRRVLKDGGVLSCSSWEGSQWIELMSMLPRIRPDVKTPEFPDEWRSADRIKGELEKAGFRDVESHRVAVSMTFEKLEPLIDFFMNKMPHNVMLLRDWSEEDRGRLKSLWMQEAGKMSDSKEPGELTGTALVAVGRK